MKPIDWEKYPILRNMKQFAHNGNDDRSGFDRELEQLRIEAIKQSKDAGDDLIIKLMRLNDIQHQILCDAKNGEMRPLLRYFELEEKLASENER